MMSYHNVILDGVKSGVRVSYLRGSSERHAPLLPWVDQLRLTIPVPAMPYLVTQDP